MVDQFYQVFCRYADDLLRLMETHVVRSLGEDGLEPGVSGYDAEHKQTWREFLKHCRGWNRKLVDKEVGRILKSMAGLVADMDSDSDDDDEGEGRSSSNSASDLASFRSTLETYMEYARWVYMSSLTDSNADPVDDIPAIQLSDFVSYFVNVLTRQRAVKTGMFLSYDELNQAKVIQPCIVDALRRTIPEKVYTSLIKARLASARNRRQHSTSGAGYTTSHSLGSNAMGRSRRPLVRSEMMRSDMMSSRSVAERLQARPQTLITSAAAALAAKRQVIAKRPPSTPQNVDPEPEKAAPISTADVPTIESQESEGKVIAVNLDESMQTEDFRSEAEPPSQLEDAE